MATDLSSYETDVSQGFRLITNRFAPIQTYFEFLLKHWRITLVPII